MSTLLLDSEVLDLATGTDHQSRFTATGYILENILEATSVSKLKKYRAQNKSLQILLNRTQARPGRAVKEQQ